MAAYWSTTSGNIAEFMNSVPKVVFSNTLEEATCSNTRLVKGRAEDEVVRLKGEPGKDLSSSAVQTWQIRLRRSV
jgi:hypothetical protein